MREYIHKMENPKYHFGTTLIVGLAIASCFVTIILFITLTDSATRPPTFAFTIFWVCFLEVLIFVFIGRIQFLGFSNIWVPALYPTFGMLILGFSITSLFTVFATARHTKIYYSLIALETLLFVIIFGLLLVFNRFKLEIEDKEQMQKRRQVVLSVDADHVYSQFIACRNQLPRDAFRLIEENLVRLKDKFKYTSSFGRFPELTNNEAQIAQTLEQLSKQVESLNTRDQKDGELAEINKTIREILDLLESHDRLIIR